MKPRIMVCTPIHGVPDSGSVTLAYHRMILNWARDPNVLEMVTSCCQSDLVRSRSYAVHQFLACTEATHLLWVDADVAAHPEKASACISAMLASGHDVVAAPYPGKRVDWLGAASAVLEGGQPEWGAYSYGFRGGGQLGPDHCITVDVCRGGFMLVSRRCLEAMVAKYRDELWFTHIVEGKRYEVVAIYMLSITALRYAELTTTERSLDAEDFAFCERWRAMGGEIRLYIGPHAPLNHIGSNVFRGHLEGIYRSAETKPADGQ